VLGWAIKDFDGTMKVMDMVMDIPTITEVDYSSIILSEANIISPQKLEHSLNWVTQDYLLRELEFLSNFNINH
jgi:hypothetical protein